MALAPLRQSLPEAARRCVGGKRCRADRLAEKDRDVLGAHLVERRVQRRERRVTGRVEASGRGWDMRVPRQVRPEGSLEARPAGKRERLHRRPVVGLRRRDHLPPLRLAALDVVAARQHERHLVGLRAARDELGVGETLGGDGHELARQALLERVRQPLVVDVGEALCLAARRLDDIVAAPPQHLRHRAAAHGVQVAAARRVLEPHPLGADDHRVAPIELRREHFRRPAVHECFRHDHAPVRAIRPQRDHYIEITILLPVVG